MRVRGLGFLALVLVASGATCEGTTEPPPDTCEEGVTNTLTIGSPTTGAVAGGDCELPNGDGRRGDSYNFTVETASFFSYNVIGETETGIRIRQGDTEIALHDYGVANYNGVVALTPGTYTIDISADENDAAGEYSIGSGFPPANQPAGCLAPPERMRFAMIGATVSAQITSGDCAGSGQYRVDNYNVMAPAGTPRKVTVTVPAGVTITVEIRRIDNPALATAPAFRSTAGDLVVNFTPSAKDYYNIAIISLPGATAPVAYTVKFE